jgi:hypothetical protein
VARLLASQLPKAAYSWCIYAIVWFEIHIKLCLSCMQTLLRHLVTPGSRSLQTFKKIGQSKNIPSRLPFQNDNDYSFSRDMCILLVANSQKLSGESTSAPVLTPITTFFMRLKDYLQNYTIVCIVHDRFSRPLSNMQLSLFEIAVLCEFLALFIIIHSKLYSESLKSFLWGFLTERTFKSGVYVRVR